MLDVLLVEPSKAMVQIYKNMIPWELYGFTIASVCDSEQQAISYYGEYNYALVICDLRLAVGDGLSLIRKLRELDAHCQIAVISDQCDYASLRSAFRLHVIDFLQKKEIRASSLLDLLLEVRSHYERESEPSPQAEVEKLLGHVRDHQTIDETLLEDRLAQAGGSLLQQPYVLVYVRMDNVRQINRKLKIYDHPDWISESEFMMLYKSRLKQREELRRSIMKCISTQLQLHPYLLWLIKRHSALLLIPYEKRDAFLAQAERLKAALESECRAEFSITVSALKTQGGGAAFLADFRALMEGGKKKFYVGDSSVIDLAKCEEWSELHISRFPQHAQLQNALLAHNGEKALSCLFRLLRVIFDNRVSQARVSAYFISFFDWMEKNMHIKEMEDLSLQKEAVAESETFTFLSYELERIFKTFHDQLSRLHTSRAYRISVMKAYIEEHLCESFDLHEAAKAAGITYAYGSRIMKEECGEPLLQYVNRRRIVKAAELLAAGDQQIQVIAETVGFGDALYFSRQFHKLMKESPRAYRKRLQNMDEKKGDPGGKEKHGQNRKKGTD